MCVDLQGQNKKQFNLQTPVQEAQSQLTDLIKEVGKDPESHAHESPPWGTNVKDPALRNLRAFNSHCVPGYP